MRIYLTGATGFIGASLARALAAAGHEVVGTTRRARGPRDAPDGLRYVRADFAARLEPGDWLADLQGMDVVINAAGILRQDARRSFDLMHRRAPCALFAACAQAGVRRVVQISALGADAGARSAYHVSKRAGDRCLEESGVRSVIVQPSLVYGPGGASAAWFDTLASLPLVALPGGGTQGVQPVHIDDVVEALTTLVAMPEPPARIALVGPRPLALREFLSQLRASLGITRRLRILDIPLPVSRFVARLAGRFPGSLLDADTLGMLERGNTADAGAMRRLLGRAPREPARFVPPVWRQAARSLACLRWLLPVLRASIGAVWIVSGVVSLGLYPVDASYDLLARAGAPAPVQPLLLYGAAALDLALGVLTFSRWRGRPLWLAQALLMLAYTAIISWKLPEFWLHPYGPVLKNLPMLAGLGLLAWLEDRRWNT